MNHVTLFFANSCHRKLCRFVAVITLSCVLLLIACGPIKKIFGGGKSEAEKELEYAKKLCSAESMVGVRKGIKAELEAKRDKLDSLRVSIGVEKYKALSQELVGYNVEWETLNQAMERACLDWAICQYRTRESASYTACSEAREIKNKSENDARTFFEKIKKFDREHTGND